MSEYMKKENIELMINSDLLRLAKEYNIDLDEALERSIEKALSLKNNAVTNDKEKDTEEL